MRWDSPAAVLQPHPVQWRRQNCCAVDPACCSLGSAGGRRSSSTLRRHCERFLQPAADAAAAGALRHLLRQLAHGSASMAARHAGKVWRTTARWQRAAAAAQRLQTVSQPRLAAEGAASAVLVHTLLQHVTAERSCMNIEDSYVSDCIAANTCEVRAEVQSMVDYTQHYSYTCSIQERRAWLRMRTSVCRLLPHDWTMKLQLRCCRNLSTLSFRLGLRCFSGMSQLCLVNREETLIPNKIDDNCERVALKAARGLRCSFVSSIPISNTWHPLILLYACWASFVSPCDISRTAGLVPPRLNSWPCAMQVCCSHCTSDPDSATQLCCSRC